MAKRFKKMRSPIGEAVWPKLSQPETKFDPDGVYETKLRLDNKTGMAFQSTLQEMLDEHHKQVCSERGKKVKAAALPVTEVEEDGTPTGELEFKFKLKALAGKEGSKWEQRPKLIDAKGANIDPNKVTVGSGSKISVGFEVIPYFTAAVGAGLSLRMKAVQVIDLVEYGGNEFDAFGFQQEEGYETSEEAESTTEDVEEDDCDF